MGNSQSQTRSSDTTDQPAQAQTHSQARYAEPIERNLPLETNDGDRIQRTDHMTGVRRSVFSTARHSILTDSWRRDSQRFGADNDPTFDPLDDRPYESDDRPLFHSDHDPPVEPHAERPPNWRNSTMSRLGTRLLPDSVARGLTNSGEESAEEGQALRNGLSSRSRPSVYHRRITSNSQERSSVNASIRRMTTEPMRNSSRSVVRRFFSSTSAAQPIQIRDDDDENRSSDVEIHDSLRDNSTAFGMPTRSRTRMQRVRHSLAAPFSSFLNPDRLASRRSIQSPPPRPSRRGVLEESDELLSQPHTADYRSEMADQNLHELDAVEPETRNVLSSSRITSGMSTIRRFPHGLRSRSTRLIRRGEHPPLSQVLQLAAAAIAAQLSGTSINATDGSGTGGEAFDGSMQNFVQTLQEAASAQAGQNIDLNAPDGDLPPVNFMRVFQFPNDENGTPLAAPPAETSEGDDHTPDQGDRSVTLVLVGVRSMPNFIDNHSTENGTLGPSLDTLLSLPFLPPANLLRNGSSGALFRRSDTRTRTQNRRNSMTNFSFPQQYESQRHTRARTSGATRTSVENGLLTPMSESPPGPNPPPSTPADIRSGHATPIRRPSSASAVHPSGLPDLEESGDAQPSNATLPAESEFHAARQRQRSDSEFARRPELSSGSSRRNGVVEPDRPAGGVGRSWLIYVVGTNVSPDHPAFTMPSLFTDNPSYEDMQTLSTLLGPVKPPVASHDDVEAAGGLYRITIRGGTLVAESTNAAANAHVLTINAGDRCLICLSEYEEHDYVRQIDSCHHVYHRECIDEWLTTGRNSCPMCRGQGVKENSSTSNANSQAEQSESA